MKTNNGYDWFRTRLLTREGFLGLTTVSIGGLAALAAGIPILGYVIGPVVDQPKDVWTDIRFLGADGRTGQIMHADAIEVGRTEKVIYSNNAPTPWAGATGKNVSWLRRTGPEQFTAFSINCTHLGCPVKWLEGGHIFLCPCHGSVFNSDGTVAGGPAAKPLVQYPIRIHEATGRLQIKTHDLPEVF